MGGADDVFEPGWSLVGVVSATDVDGGSEGGSDKVNGATGGNVGGAGGIVSGAEVSSVRIRHGNEMMKIGLRKSDV